MHPLGEPIDDNEYNVEAMRRGKMGYEVHGDIFPYPRRSWQWLKKTSHALGARLMLLTYLTLTNELLNVMP